MVLAQHVEQLLRLGRLGEAGEPAQVAEQAGDVGAVAGEQLLSLVGGDELGHLRGDEPGQLATLALDGVEQAGILDRDCGLVGEGLDQLDLLIGERRGFAADRR